MAAGWTEIVRTAEHITDEADGRRLMESRLAELGVNVDDLDLSTDIEIRLWRVRMPDGSASSALSYHVRDEALRGPQSPS
jgi:hypothetical protein